MADVEATCAIAANRKAMHALRKAMKRKVMDCQFDTADVWSHLEKLEATSERLAESSTSLMKKHRVAVEALATVSDALLTSSIAIAKVE